MRGEVKAHQFQSYIESDIFGKRQKYIPYLVDNSWFATTTTE